MEKEVEYYFTKRIVSDVFEKKENLDEIIEKFQIFFRENIKKIFLRL